MSVLRNGGAHNGLNCRPSHPFPQVGSWSQTSKLHGDLRLQRPGRSARCPPKCPPPSDIWCPQAYLKWMAEGGKDQLLPGLELTYEQLFFVNYAQVAAQVPAPQAIPRPHLSLEGPLYVFQGAWQVSWRKMLGNWGVNAGRCGGRAQNCVLPSPRPQEAAALEVSPQPRGTTHPSQSPRPLATPLMCP